MSTENSYEKLLTAIKDYKRSDVIKLLSEGAVVDIPKEEMNAVISSIVGLRDTAVMDELVKVVKPLKAAMLDIDLKNKNNQDFIGVVITKYLSAFDTNNAAEMDSLFAKACAVGNVEAVNTFMKKGIGSGAIPKLGSACEDVFSLLKKINPNSLSVEQRVGIYTEAAMSLNGADKLNDLAKWGYDVKESTVDGKSVKTALKEKIKADKYPNNKNGVAAKQHDKSTLNAIDHIDTIGKPYKSPMKYILIGVLAVAVVVGGVFGVKAIKKAVTPEKLTVENGDEVEISFTGYVDGEAFEGGTSDSFNLVIGSNTFIDDFEEQLIGHNVGDDVTVEVTFPDDYFVDSQDYYHVAVEGGEGKLAGKDATFEVHIKDIIE